MSMKRILLGATSPDLLGTLEIILKHWGYRVLVTSRIGEFGELLNGSNPEFILIGSGMLATADETLLQRLREQIRKTGLPLVILGQPHGPTIPEPWVGLDVPIDIFALFELVQKHLEKHPRRNLRMEVRIPGMVCRDNTSELAEVLSISTRGMFIKTSYRLEPEDQFQVVFPLLGMNRELELPGRVVYRMEPRPENNYRQGVGLEFADLSDETRRQLEAFLEQRLLGELSVGRRGAEFDLGMLRSRAARPSPGIVS